MFSYNRFWHFWYTLNNRNYSRMFGGALIFGLLLLVAFSFAFPMISLPVWGMAGLIIAPALVVASVTYLFTKLSDFFYNRQNQKLEALKREPISEENQLFNDQVDLYLNRRVVCPPQLLAGELLTFPQVKNPLKNAKQVERPFTVDTDEELTVTPNEKTGHNRNPSYKVRGGTGEIFLKETAAIDALSEVSAREMAELMGFRDLIPANTVTRKPEELELQGQVPSETLMTSKQSVAHFIDEENRARTEENEAHTPIKNTPGVQNAVAKFILNMKMAAYKRIQAKEGRELKLLYMQEKVPEATDGLKVYEDLFSAGGPAQPALLSFLGGESGRVRFERARQTIEQIDLDSFQDNFLLQIILGSQDCNPGNTLFTTVEGPRGTTKQKIHSIDHERIMPEDNYNITKSIPMMNGSKFTGNPERPIENVFPIRLWLAGLPQAEVPFSKEMIYKTLANLDPDRLLEYHRQKKLFSPAAVGAQLERVNLIRSLFEEEMKKDKPTLTPRELFLRLVNNHPSYCFLKQQQKLSDFTTFMLLGFVPENADWSLVRHPLQTWGLWARAIEVQQRVRQMQEETALAQFNNLLNTDAGHQPNIDDRLFSDESFATSSAPRFFFFAAATGQKENEKVNKRALDALDEIAETCRSRACGS